MTDKITANFVFEILGKPPEHIKETLSQMIDKLEVIKGVKIENKKVHEPKLVEDEKVKDIYTTFAEVEITSETASGMLAIVFNMFPAHIEIIEPETIGLENFEFSELLNELIVKLHRYDELAKRWAIEKGILLRKMKELEGKQENQPKEIVEEKTEKSKKKKPKKN